MNQVHRPYAGGSIPENYERHLVPLLFLDYGADLASRPDVPAGGAVLETACGTGAVTRHLQARLPEDSRFTVTDLAAPMVEHVRRVVGDHPNIAYRQADATDLPFPNDSFDAVICQFSLMLFPDKVKGMQEAAEDRETQKRAQELPSKSAALEVDGSPRRSVATIVGRFGHRSTFGPRSQSGWSAMSPLSSSTRPR